MTRDRSIHCSCYGCRTQLGRHCDVLKSVIKLAASIPRITRPCYWCARSAGNYRHVYDANCQTFKCSRLFACGATCQEQSACRCPQSHRHFPPATRNILKILIRQTRYIRWRNNENKNSDELTNLTINNAVNIYSTKWQGSVPGIQHSRSQLESHISHLWSRLTLN